MRPSRPFWSRVSRLTEGVPEEELAKAKRLIAGRLLLRMEDTRAVSGWMGNQELLLGHVSDLEEVMERIDAVTEDEIRRVATELLVTQRLNVAVVGPNRGQRRLQQLLKL